MTDRPALELLLGDVLRLRRPHPCGGSEWLVDRLGADIGLRCRTCGRHVLVERRTVERRLAAFVSRGDPALSAAIAPRPPAAEPPAAEPPAGPGATAAAAPDPAPVPDRTGGTGA
jgi:hypothetical protein